MFWKLRNTFICKKLVSQRNHMETIKYFELNNNIHTNVQVWSQESLDSRLCIKQLIDE